MILAFILAVLIIIADQLSKILLYGKSFSLIGDFLWIESTLNTGASFGIFQNGTIFFIILSIPMIAVMIWLIVSKKIFNNKFFKVALGVLLGGTIGNLIDRIIFGGVRDFIYFKSINFAIFNVADIAITISAFMLAIFLIIEIITDIVNANKNKNENKEENENNKLTNKDIVDDKHHVAETEDFQTKHKEDMN